MRNRSRWTPPHPATAPRRICCWPKCHTAAVLDLPMCRPHLAVAHDVYQTVFIDTDRNKPAPAPAPPKPAPEGTVYYVQVDAHIKIGWTSDLTKRMRGYAPTSRLLATHPGTRADEQRMHKRFAVHRTHGREWYAPVPSLLHHIELVKAEHGEPDAVAFGAAPVTIPEPRPTHTIRPIGGARHTSGVRR
ncbi:MAG: GIY-YIG nuclease family protein [Motilibacteraceae bacterium]